MSALAHKEFLSRLISGYRGVAQNWECDLMGHLSVSFYFGRSSDQAFFLRHALGLRPSEMRAQNRGTVALEEHVRFHKEVLAGGLMVGRSAVVEIGERTMTTYQELRDEHGALICTFKTLIGCFDTKNRKLIEWSDDTRANATKWQIDLPPHAQPKFLSGNGRVPPYTIEQTLGDGFFLCGGAGVNNWECDQFGHMNTMFYSRRMTEAAPHMWHEIGIDLRGRTQNGMGSVVGEMCVSYLRELHAGDMAETYSTITELDEKTVLVEHRLFNTETGILSALARLRVVHFDLKTRRACAWPDDVFATMRTGLSQTKT